MLLSRPSSQGYWHFLSGDIFNNKKMINPIGNEFHHMGFDFLQKDFKGRFHPGVDLNDKGTCNDDLGKKVYNIHRGLFEGYVNDKSSGWGEMIRIYHPDIRLWSVYGHVQNVKNKAVRWIEEGEHIADIGNAGGKWCAHIHFELRKTASSLTYYPSKALKKAEIRANYEDPLKYIDNYNKNMPKEEPKAPHFDGDEVKKLYYACWGYRIKTKDAIKTADDYKDKGHELVTKLLQDKQHTKWIEKIGNMEDELKECKKQTIAYTTFRNLYPDLMASMNNLNDLFIKLKP